MAPAPFTPAQEARLRQIAGEEIEASFQGIVQLLSCMKIAASPSESEGAPAVRATVRHLRDGVQKSDEPVAALRDLQASLGPIIAELKAARSRRETDSENLNSQLAATSAALRGAL